MSSYPLLRDITGSGGGIPSAPDTSIQYNLNGVFGGSVSFSYIYNSQSLQQGLYTLTPGNYSHAEGAYTTASSNSSHAEGLSTVTYGYASHAEGYNTKAYSDNSHTEGKHTITGWRGFDVSIASNIAYTLNDVDVTPAFPDSPGTALLYDQNFQTYFTATYTSVTYTPTVGSEIIISSPTLPDSAYAIADINNLLPPLTDFPFNISGVGEGQHAQGSGSQAIGNYSNASGLSTLALGRYQSIFGQFNDYNFSQSAFIIGDGDDITTRHNVLFVSKSHFEVSASNTFLQGLSSSYQNNVLTYNSQTGKVFYNNLVPTASKVSTNNDGAPQLMFLTFVRQTGSQYQSLGVDSDLTYNSATNTIFATASWAQSASQAITASYALNSATANTFPYTGSATITGSLVMTGSMFVSGAISASFGENTVGFYGTASWATNALSSSKVLTSADQAPVNMYLTYVRQTSSQYQSLGIDPDLVYDAVNNRLYTTASYALSSSYNLSSTSSIIGNNLSSSFTINHSFNTRNLHITVYENGANGETVYPDIRRINDSTVNIIFANPPSSSQYVVYISQ